MLSSLACAQQTAVSFAKRSKIDCSKSKTQVCKPHARLIQKKGTQKFLHVDTCKIGA